MNDMEKELRELRKDVVKPDSDAVDAARRTFLDGVSSEAAPSRRRASERFGRSLALPLASATAAVALLLFVTLQLVTGSHEATAADIEDIAGLAERQTGRIELLGQGQYLLSRFATVAEMSTTYDEATLAALLAGADASSGAAEPDRAYFGDATNTRIERDRRAAARRKREVESLTIDDLPAKIVTAERKSESVEWMDGEHVGGESQLPNTAITFGSRDQAATAAKLRLAGVGGGFNELALQTVNSDVGRFDRFTWPSDEVRDLPAEPEALAKRLRSKPLPFPLVRDGRSVHDDEELFHVAIGLLRSPFAKPSLRAATVRMIGGISGVTVAESAKDAQARNGFGVTLTNAVPRPELVIDKRNSSVLGVNYLIDRPDRLKAEELKVLPHSDSARAGTVFEPALVVDGAPVCSSRTASGRTVERYCPWKVRPVN